MSDKIWILHACNRLSIGGVQAFLMNYYRHIDRDRIQFAFAVQRNEELSYDKEIIEMGGRIHYLPRMEDGALSYIKELAALLNEHPEYQIIHAHMNQRNAIALATAKARKVKIRISHAHNTCSYKTFVQKARYNLFKLIIAITGTHFWACSNAANECLHYPEKKNTWILHNAIDITRFKYDEEVRSCIRTQYGIDPSKIVVGHVGNFSSQKNTGFLISLIRELPDNFMLLLVGEGEEKDSLMRRCKNESLNNRVIFTGVQDSSIMYQAMDVFAFPSKFEGLGMVAIEAMTSGLQVIASSGVPEEVDISNSIIHLPIGEENIGLWKNAIINTSYTRNGKASYEVRKAGYDVNYSVKELMARYEKLVIEGI